MPLMVFEVRGKGLGVEAVSVENARDQGLCMY